jgi:hypothetical protein
MLPQLAALPSAMPGAPPDPVTLFPGQQPAPIPEPPLATAPPPPVPVVPPPASIPEQQPAPPPPDPATPPPEGPPRFTVEDVPEVLKDPEFLSQEPAKRERMLDYILSSAAGDVAADPTYDRESYLAFGEFAAKARAKLDELKTMGESVSGAADTVGSALKGIGADVGVTLLAGGRLINRAAGAAADAVGLDGLAANAARQPDLDKAFGESVVTGGQKALDWISQTITKVWDNTDAPLDEAFDRFKTELEDGRMPLQDPAAFRKWLNDWSAIIEPHQRKWLESNRPMFRDKVPAEQLDAALKVNTLATPEHAAMVAAYMQTRSPAALDDLRSSMYRTAERIAIQKDEAATLASPAATWLDRTFGPGSSHHLVSGADPINLMSWALPAIRGAAVAGKTAAAVEAATGVAAKSRAVAWQVLKQQPTHVGFGALVALKEDPNASTDEVTSSIGDMLLLGNTIAGGMATLKLGTGKAAEVAAKYASRDKAPPIRPAVIQGAVAAMRKEMDGFTQLDPDTAAIFHRRQTEVWESGDAATMPESLFTLESQFKLLRDGRKPAVFVEGLAPEELPEAFQPRPDEAVAAAPNGGSLIYRTEAWSPETVRAGFAEGKIGELVGFPPGEVPAAPTAAMVLRDAKGREKISIVVDETTKASAAKTLEGWKDKGDTINEMMVDEVLMMREEQRVAEGHAIDRAANLASDLTPHERMAAGLPVFVDDAAPMEAAATLSRPAPSRANQPTVKDSVTVARDPAAQTEPALVADPNASPAEAARAVADPTDGGDTVFSKAGASLPLTQTPGRGAVSVPQWQPGDRPITLPEVNKQLLSKLKLPMRVGRFRENAYGLYKILPRIIRQRAFNDVSTTAHEVGHHLHFILFPPVKPASGRTTAANWGGRFDAELAALGARTSRPSYSQTLVRMEGVAEFTREYLTDPAVAWAKAPQFAAHWESYLGKNHPDVLRHLQRVQRTVATYINQPTWVKKQAAIEFDPAAAVEAGRDPGGWIRTTYAKWVNSLQPIQSMTNRIAREAPALAPAARALNTWVENHRGGWQSKAEGDLQFKQTNLSGTVVGKSLKEHLDGIAHEDRQNFSTYIAVKRAIELERRGIESGFDMAGEPIPAAEMAAWEAKFEKARQGILEYQRRSLGLLIQSGLLERESAVAMSRANLDYVPFHRIYERLTGVDIGATSASAGYVNASSGIKRIKGSDRQILDPLQSIIRNTYVFRSIAEKNHIGLQFVDLVQDVTGGGKYADAIAPRLQAVKVSHADMRAQLKKAGVLTEQELAAMDNAGVDLSWKFFQQVHRPDSKSGEVIVHRDGKPEHYQITDKGLYEALNAAETGLIAGLKKSSPALYAALTAPVRLLRFGATGHPLFALMNWTRDQFAAATFSKTGFVPFVDGVRGIKSVLRKDAVYQEWVGSGGKFAGDVTGAARLKASLDDLIPQDSKSRAAYEFLKSPSQWIEKLGVAGQLMEEATRVREFGRARERGYSPMEAANLSKEVTLNFARSGEMSRALNSVIAFFNAGLQDLDKVIREHDPRNPAQLAKTMMKGFMYITPISVMSWYLGKDDPEIQGLPEYRKNFFWNFNLKPIAKALGRDDAAFILTIPKPFMMGAIYGTTVERSLDAMSGRDPSGIKKAGINLWQNTLFRGDLVSGLTALQPAAEILANRDLFTMQDIVPNDMKAMDKGMQFNERTSEFAKLMGETIGVSPLHIDHLVRGHLATVGAGALDVADWTLAKLGAVPDVPAPAKDAWELPLASKFVLSPYQRAIDVDRFYTAAKEMEALLATDSQLAHVPDRQRAAWLNANAERFRYYNTIVDPESNITRKGQLRKAMKELGTLSKAMTVVRQDPKMTPEAKRAKLIELTKARNALAGAALKGFHPADRAEALAHPGR